MPARGPVALPWSGHDSSDSAFKRSVARVVRCAACITVDGSGHCDSRGRDGKHQTIATRHMDYSRRNIRASRTEASADCVRTYAQTQQSRKSAFFSFARTTTQSGTAFAYSALHVPISVADSSPIVCFSNFSVGFSTFSGGTVWDVRLLPARAEYIMRGS